jgi:hypothetical protein
VLSASTKIDDGRRALYAEEISKQMAEVESELKQHEEKTSSLVKSNSERQKKFFSMISDPKKEIEKSDSSPISKYEYVPSISDDLGEVAHVRDFGTVTAPPPFFFNRVRPYDGRWLLHPDIERGWQFADLNLGWTRVVAMAGLHTRTPDATPRQNIDATVEGAGLAVTFVPPSSAIAIVSGNMTYSYDLDLQSSNFGATHTTGVMCIRVFSTDLSGGDERLEVNRNETQLWKEGTVFTNGLSGGRDRLNDIFNTTFAVVPRRRYIIWFFSNIFCDATPGLNFAHAWFRANLNYVTIHGLPTL